MRFKPVDYLTFIYFFLITSLIVFFRHQVWHWTAYVIWHLLYIVMVLLLVWGEQRAPRNVWLRFFRYTYAIITSAFVYSAIEGYVLVLHGTFLDPVFNQLEKNIFSVYPNLYLERFVSKPVTEFFMFNYFSYYFYIVIPPLLLFVKKRMADLEQWVFAIMLAFYVSYLGFVLVPALGPIFSLQDLFTIKTLEGYVFTPLQTFIMAHGDPKGSCYPSSHVAVAWVALLSIRRIFGNKPFWIILPFTLCLSIAVVYNRFHYVSDLFAGLITAGICYGVSRIIYTRIEKADKSSNVF